MRPQTETASKQIRYIPRGNIYSIACQNNDYKGIEVTIIKSENDPQIYAYTRYFKCLV